MTFLSNIFSSFKTFNGSIVSAFTGLFSSLFSGLKL